MGERFQRPVAPWRGWCGGVSNAAARRAWRVEAPEPCALRMVPALISWFDAASDAAQGCADRRVSREVVKCTLRKLRNPGWAQLLRGTI